MDFCLFCDPPLPVSDNVNVSSKQPSAQRIPTHNPLERHVTSFKPSFPLQENIIFDKGDHVQLGEDFLAKSVHYPC